MASQEVTGKTPAQLDEMKADWLDRHPETPFEEQYCLAQIGKQPDSYDGPQRYCANQNTFSTGTTPRCKHHGGTQLNRNTENLDPLANMSHGMKATREHLVQDFDEKDRKLYDWITESYTEAYDIDPQSEPAVAYDLHRLAAEIVRAERGRGFLINEGEVHEKEVKDDEGRVVVDENGEVVTEKSEHYLAQMMHRQDKKITQLEKELGVTRKEQRRHENEEDAVGALKDFAELGSAFLQRDDKDYDPDESPWEDEDSD